VSSFRRNRAEAIAFFGFTSPWFLGFVALGALPLVFSLIISFTSFQLYGFHDFHWIGLRNYRNAWSDTRTVQSLKDTAVVTAIFVPLGIVVQIALAVLLNTTTRLRGLFRTLFYLPAVIPAVVGILLIWKGVVTSDGGVFDTIYHVFRPHAYVDWLQSHARLVLILFMIWSTSGLGMLVFLAGLQNISRELRDAATADGATPFQTLRTITLPLLTPVIFLQLILGLIGASQMLIQPILFGSGEASPFFNSPNPGTDVLPALVWQVSFQYIDYGRGAALGWMLFLIVLGGTLLLFGTSRRWVYYGSD
jgi:multiple sugar transport system permease protein